MDRRLRGKAILALGLGLILAVTIVSLQPEGSLFRSKGFQTFTQLRADLRSISNIQINQSRARILELIRQRQDLNQTEADSTAVIYSIQLSDSVRVLCMVLTSPWTVKSKAKFIKNTWGRRCNRTVFVSSSNDKELPSIKVIAKDGEQHLAQKLMMGVMRLYDTDFTSGDFDWLFIAEDDTYAILENLRYFLKDKNPLEPIYYGRKSTAGDEGLSVGAGVVISKALLSRVLFAKLNVCFNRDGKDAGLILENCLISVGGILGDSTDINGNTRFHTAKPDQTAISTYVRGKEMENLGGMSDYAITFHGLPGPLLLELEYLIYHVTPAGVPLSFRSLNKPETVV